MIALLCVDLVALALPAAPGAARRAAREPSLEARLHLAAVLGGPDLALSSSSRWLRHPSLTEPTAPFTDGPAMLDVDPGGAFVAPRLPPEDAPR